MNVCDCRQVVRRFKKGACGDQFQTFPNFQKLWGKKTAGNYRQLFGYQLRQIQGCSKYVALPIINRFGSTHNFVKQMEILGKVQGTVSSYSCIYVLCLIELLEIDS